MWRFSQERKLFEKNFSSFFKLHQTGTSCVTFFFRSYKYYICDMQLMWRLPADSWKICALTCPPADVNAFWRLLLERPLHDFLHVSLIFLVVTFVTLTFFCLEFCFTFQVQRYYFFALYCNFFKRWFSNYSICSGVL